MMIRLDLSLRFEKRGRAVQLYTCCAYYLIAKLCKKISQDEKLHDETNPETFFSLLSRVFNRHLHRQALHLSACPSQPTEEGKF